MFLGPCISLHTLYRGYGILLGTMASLMNCLLNRVQVPDRDRSYYSTLQPNELLVGC